MLRETYLGYVDTGVSYILGVGDELFRILRFMLVRLQFRKNVITLAVSMVGV